MFYTCHFKTCIEMTLRDSIYFQKINSSDINKSLLFFCQKFCFFFMFDMLKLFFYTNITLLKYVVQFYIMQRYGHFSGINRKVQMKYQPKGRPRGSSSDDGNISYSTFEFF